VAAPAGGARNPASGRPRPSRPPALKTGCLEWLDAARTKEGGSLPDQGPTRASSSPGSTAPGTEKPHMERREASVPIARHAPRLASAGPMVAPRGAPSLGFAPGEKGKTAYPAPPRTGAAERWLNGFAGCLTVESANERQSDFCWRAITRSPPRKRGPRATLCEPAMASQDSRLRGNERCPDRAT
jgi:hypothetical protein